MKRGYKPMLWSFAIWGFAHSCPSWRVRVLARSHMDAHTDERMTRGHLAVALIDGRDNLAVHGGDARIALLLRRTMRFHHIKAPVTNMAAGAMPRMTQSAFTLSP